MQANSCCWAIEEKQERQNKKKTGSSETLDGGLQQPQTGCIINASSSLRARKKRKVNAESELKSTAAAQIPTLSSILLSLEPIELLPLSLARSAGDGRGSRGARGGERESPQRGKQSERRIRTCSVPTALYFRGAAE